MTLSLLIDKGRCRWCTKAHEGECGLIDLQNRIRQLEHIAQLNGNTVRAQQQEQRTEKRAIVRALLRLKKRLDS